jgi:hypothetical protein
MCNRREMHHRRTWKLGLATVEGEQEITCNYKYKRDIIRPALCSMAIKLETTNKHGRWKGQHTGEQGTPHGMDNNNHSWEH